MGSKMLQMRSVDAILLVLVMNVLCYSSDIMAASEKVPKKTSTAFLIRVDQSGHGDYTKIQDAIDAVPSNNSDLFFILVKPGTYREKIVVPADKPFITLSGTTASKTIITWNDGGYSSDSPTMRILASNFVARFLTIQNTYGTSGKGVALRVAGDKAAFYSCRILSYQDTLLDDAGRHYYKNCYIEGATDFIYGNAASLYEKCRIHSISASDGAITAQKRESPQEETGFVFLECKITGEGSAVLGRPWGSYAKVVFAFTYMSSVVQPEGWNDWGDPTKQRSVYYSEYRCYGPGANTENRVNWSHILSDEEAAPFLSKNWIGEQDWLRPIPSHFEEWSSSNSTIAPKSSGRN